MAEIDFHDRKKNKIKKCSIMNDFKRNHFNELSPHYLKLNE